MIRNNKLVLVLCGAMMFAGGCASKEAIKKDQPIAPSAATAPKPTTEKAATPVKHATVVGTALTDSTKPSSPAQAPVAQQAQKALDRVYFDFDSADLSTLSRDTLAKNAAYLKANASVKIQVAGNCDERGSDEYNLALGEKRAKAAAQYLVTMGIPATRLATISYGKEKPADPGHNEAAWAKNRRDEFVILSN